MAATDAAATSTNGGGKAPGVLSHPRGLYVLFFTEMWERFSYYGMRALLVPYMLNYLLFQPAASSSTYKWYTSLVYLTPLAGGIIADRFLGLRNSIVLGGVLMAVGHFLMAFEDLSFFYAALGFLIAGNGFFKPNISTLVGRMYRPSDPRRDGAFTIFYMGINLGAFLAPFVCGGLRQWKGPHWGFGAAGVGMIVGLVVFLLGQKRVVADVLAAGNDVSPRKPDATGTSTREPDPDEEKPRATGAAAILALVFPYLMVLGGAGIVAYYIHQVRAGEQKAFALVMPLGFLGVFIAINVLLRRIRGASRDKSTVIFVLFCAAVLFWMAFEQAGNTLNIWAVTHTELRIGAFEYPAEWFQSVNAALIFALGLPFAALWLFLAKRQMEPSTPLKMMAGVLLVGLSFVPMVMGAAAENATITSVKLDRLPPGVDLTKINAGRMSYDDATNELRVRGVLPLFAVNDALSRTVDPKYSAALKELDRLAKDATEKSPKTFTMSELPSGWRFPLDAAEAEKLHVSTAEGSAKGDKISVVWTHERAEITVTGSLDAPVKGNLIAAGAPAEFREPLRELQNRSQRARVSGIWLVLSYLIATVGELCLSPVGLSMVTKLAPARFASMFMGIWMLASSVAQYAGGTLGEKWGTIAPGDYFRMFVWICVIGAAALLVLVKPLRKLMHDVH